MTTYGRTWSADRSTALTLWGEWPFEKVLVLVFICFYISVSTMKSARTEARILHAAVSNMADGLRIAWKEGANVIEYMRLQTRGSGLLLLSSNGIRVSLRHRFLKRGIALE